MRYRAAADTLSAMLSDGVVVVSLRNKRYFSLNRTGAQAWMLLERGATAREITTLLLQDYAVSEPEAREAVDRLLAELSAEGLIEVAE